MTRRRLEDIGALAVFLLTVAVFWYLVESGIIS